MLTGPLPPISNLATWRDTAELRDAETGELIDLETDIEEITVTIRDPRSESDELAATLSGDAITVLGVGVFEFVFTAEEMSNLDPKTYEIGCLVKFTDASGGDTEQVILGTISVIRGL